MEVDFKIIRNDEYGIEVHFKGYKGVATPLREGIMMFTIKDANDGEFLCVHSLPILTVEDCKRFLVKGLYFLEKEDLRGLV